MGMFWIWLRECWSGDTCSLVQYFYGICRPFCGHLGEEWLLGILLPPTRWLIQQGWWGNTRARGLKVVSQFMALITGRTGIVEIKKARSKVWEAWLWKILTFGRCKIMSGGLRPSQLYSFLSGICLIMLSLQLKTHYICFSFFMWMARNRFLSEFLCLCMFLHPILDIFSCFLFP